MQPCGEERRTDVTLPQSKSSPRLVVTADDFGLSPGVDEGILEAFRRGIVSSTAVLVNFPDAAESVVRLHQEPNLEAGLHLNLTAGPPVLPPERVSSLVGASGTFHSFTTFFARAALSRINWSEVALEWRAQFERGLALGCHFTFVNSHQHVHMLPEGAQICSQLATEFGAGPIRLSNFGFSNILWPICPKAFALNPFVPAVRRIFKKDRVSFSRSILEIPPGNRDSALRQVCNRIRGLRAGAHELVCHPAHIDSILKSRDPYIGGRLIELEVLTDSRLRQCIEEIGIRRTTFAELVGGIAGNRVQVAPVLRVEESWRPAVRTS